MAQPGRRDPQDQTFGAQASDDQELVDRLVDLGLDEEQLPGRSDRRPRAAGKAEVCSTTVGVQVLESRIERPAHDLILSLPGALWRSDRRAGRRVGGSSQDRSGLPEPQPPGLRPVFGG